MKYILNYRTTSDFEDDGNTQAKEYYLYKPNSSYKSFEWNDISQCDGPFYYGGSVSIIPGVAYCADSGTVYYNGTKAPLIDLETMVGPNPKRGFSFTWTWQEFGMTWDIFNAYKAEIFNNNPVEALNVKWRPEDSINHIAYNETTGEESVGIVLGLCFLDIFENGTITFYEWLD